MVTRLLLLTSVFPLSISLCIFNCPQELIPQENLPKEGCGITPIRPHIENERIVGGKPAIPYSWPWMAGICTKRQKTVISIGSLFEPVHHEEEICEMRCGGSLIDEEWVMTAGHCVVGTINRPSKIGVLLGLYNHNRYQEPGSVLLNVSEVVRHKDWAFPYLGSNDIALLRLEQPVNFTKHIQPVCLPKSLENATENGKTAYVTAWGSVSDGGPDSAQLRQTSVTFVDMKICENEYRGEIDETMECASKPGHDSCHGDSGGPLVTRLEDGRWYQAGIVSWGMGCADGKHAGVYAKTSVFCAFIKETTGKDLCI